MADLSAHFSREPAIRVVGGLSIGSEPRSSGNFGSGDSFLDVSPAARSRALARGVGPPKGLPRPASATGALTESVSSSLKHSAIHAASSLSLAFPGHRYCSCCSLCPPHLRSTLERGSAERSSSVNSRRKKAPQRVLHADTAAHLSSQETEDRKILQLMEAQARAHVTATCEAIADRMGTTKRANQIRTLETHMRQALFDREREGRLHLHQIIFRGVLRVNLLDSENLLRSGIVEMEAVELQTMIIEAAASGRRIALGGAIYALELSQTNVRHALAQHESLNRALLRTKEGSTRPALEVILQEATERRRIQDEHDRIYQTEIKRARADLRFHDYKLALATTERARRVGLEQPALRQLRALHLTCALTIVGMQEAMIRHQYLGELEAVERLELEEGANRSLLCAEENCLRAERHADAMHDAKRATRNALQHDELHMRAHVQHACACERAELLQQWVLAVVPLLFQTEEKERNDITATEVLGFVELAESIARLQLGLEARGEQAAVVRCIRTTEAFLEMLEQEEPDRRIILEDDECCARKYLDSIYFHSLLLLRDLATEIVPPLWEQEESAARLAIRLSEEQELARLDALHCVWLILEEEVWARNRVSRSEVFYRRELKVAAAESRTQHELRHIVGLLDYRADLQRIAILVQERTEREHLGHLASEQRDHIFRAQNLAAAEATHRAELVHSAVSEYSLLHSCAALEVTALRLEAAACATEAKGTQMLSYESNPPKPVISIMPGCPFVAAENCPFHTSTAICHGPKLGSSAKC
eukprot:TRINITY_DN11356_c0_g1_i1.p1 TRINITY_DN11356_c0_g1~~TRINITY_DN11356_c0_g1_i1.p1  ORF type:complete len:770 (+),score=112.41 TRINITY_DN11356_c0_g1_i1:681-2990(+)